MVRSALIVAGGKGLRMQTDIPKQFLELNGRPVLMHTIEQFHRAFKGDIQIVLVLPKDHQDYWKSLCNTYHFEITHTIADGGQTRFESVKSGLSRCLDSGIVGIHDGVRPLISEALIHRCFAVAQEKNSALPVVAISQSLRKRNDAGSEPIDRNGMCAVQTPQCFTISTIRAAYGAAVHTNFTDDATVLEAAGHQVALVDGEETNLKITTQADLKIAEAILGMWTDR